jgi:dTDP-4-dehydrorhamnose reductase
MAPVPSSLAVECLYRVADDRMRGIHHVSAPQDISYADVARHIANRMQSDPELVQPIGIEDSGVFIEYNPAFTTLDSTEIEKKLAIRIPDALSSLDRIFFP